MSQTEVITLKNETQICVPKDIRLITNFILKEQRDWFEDEISFVREFIQPNQRALDIGANYGLYATAIADNIGPNGKLWCFEPTNDTADKLRHTIKLNGYEDPVTIVQKGLSDHIGESSFYVAENSELNSLTPNANAKEVTIELTTLDHFQAENDLGQIDFVKLDAEGEEEKILVGGQAFFSQQEPVVMFELKHQNKINTHLINAFNNLGYESFYLVPGLNVLAPFNPSDLLDGFLLNLFAIKPTRADQLEEEGFIVRSANPIDLKELKIKSLRSIEANACYKGHKATFAKLQNSDPNYQHILLALIEAKDESQAKQARFDCLMQALELTKSYLKPGQKSSPAQLSTLARVCYESGHRAVGNQILSVLLEQFIKHSKPLGLNEWFIPVNEQFEGLEPGANINVWFSCMVLDQLARKQAYSACFSGAEVVLQWINSMDKMGYLIPDMHDRRTAIRDYLAAQQVKV